MIRVKSFFRIALAVFVGAYSLNASASVPLRKGSPIDTCTVRDISEFVRSSNSSGPMSTAWWGVCAMRADGTKVYEYNSDRPLIPASNTKLITTGLAMRSLGGEHRFITSFRYTGSVQDSTLIGDLYIVGGGDPTLGVMYDRHAEPADSLFAHWLEVLRSSGIARVHGRVIGDGRYFDGRKIHPFWHPSDLVHTYGAGFDALSFNENVRSFKISGGAAPGDSAIWAYDYPEIPWETIINNARTTSRKTGFAIGLTQSPDYPESTISGTCPVGAKDAVVSYSNRFGTYTCAYLFSQYLKARGLHNSSCADIDERGYIRSDFRTSSVSSSDIAADQSQLTFAAEYASGTLKDVVWHANRVSDNLYAETLFRTMGRVIRGSAKADTCSLVEYALLDSIPSLSRKGVSLVDGSGLSRRNAMSPRFIVDFLSAMGRETFFPDYYASLTGPGAYGTLYKRLPDAKPEVKARLRAKSGSMRGVRCFSGYVLPSRLLGPDGKAQVPDTITDDTIIFSVLTNHGDDSADLMNFIDRLLEMIALQN